MSERGGAQIAVGWSETRVPLGSHVCRYYADDEELRLTLAFLRVGLDEPGEMGIVFSDASRFDQLLGWLQEGYAGSVADLVAAGKLVCVGGAPTIASLAAGITDTMREAVDRGYDVIRLLGFIGWGRTGWPDDAELLRFESAVNDVVAEYPAVVVCTYGVPVLSGLQLIAGGLQTHPSVVIGDTVVCDNPFLEIAPPLIAAESA